MKRKSSKSESRAFSAPGRAHIVIKGAVQGVGFRYFVQRSAEQLELKGWVKNIPNGDVEAVFEGDEARIQLMLDKCVAGPPAASVTHAEINWIPFTGEFDSFSMI